MEDNDDDDGRCCCVSNCGDILKQTWVKTCGKSEGTQGKDSSYYYARRVHYLEISLHHSPFPPRSGSSTTNFRLCVGNMSARQKAEELNQWVKDLVKNSPQVGIVEYFKSLPVEEHTHYTIKKGSFGVNYMLQDGQRKFLEVYHEKVKRLHKAAFPGGAVEEITGDFTPTLPFLFDRLVRPHLDGDDNVKTAWIKYHYSQLSSQGMEVR